ncbi:unnamed protein product [Vitrella brassicaformis CCMP3155]|uniref:Uncharacterized protein n=1 Tax=Vitrella brassicaformis (strain CCMP3155) TaxID=1169540 RepID=A0A0G4F7L5_VITBC|nr:unnamed protein product [Vitrella brassicaformis CCMP3155]|eukprot:CEM07991.1 unnamed protein product [Vitrella brassicaformis CCMP3155]
MDAAAAAAAAAGAVMKHPDEALVLAHSATMYSGGEMAMPEQEALHDAMDEEEYRPEMPIPRPSHTHRRKASDRLRSGGPPSTGAWSVAEKWNFFVGFAKYGHSWVQVAAEVGTRTHKQCRSHFQKTFLYSLPETERQERAQQFIQQELERNRGQPPLELTDLSAPAASNPLLKTSGDPSGGRHRADSDKPDFRPIRRTSSSTNRGTAADGDDELMEDAKGPSSDDSEAAKPERRAAVRGRGRGGGVRGGRGGKGLAAGRGGARKGGKKGRGKGKRRGGRKKTGTSLHDLSSC